MTRILALDPGITTGYALLEEGGTLLESGNLAPEDLAESILVDFASEMDLEVIQEQVPVPTVGSMNKVLQGVLADLRHLFPDPILISPGTWKGVLPIANYPVPYEWDGVNFTQHQKDAYRLGLYYLIFVKKYPIGV